MVVKYADGGEVKKTAKVKKSAKAQKGKRGRGLKAQAGMSREAMIRQDLTQDLAHPDPARRENARAALAELGRAR